MSERLKNLVCDPGVKAALRAIALEMADESLGYVDFTIGSATSALHLRVFLTGITVNGVHQKVKRKLRA